MQLAAETFAVEWEFVVWNAAKGPALMAEVVDTAGQCLADYFVAVSMVLADSYHYWEVDLLVAGYLVTWESATCRADFDLVAIEQVQTVTERWAQEFGVEKSAVA